jgi:GNAT superfamily N-acetyltransferase
MPSEIHELSVDALAAVNAVIAAAIETWDVAPRVKRLALPTYQYREDDFNHLHLLGAWREGRLAGFVSLEPADPDDVPGDHSALLVHGLYVLPDLHGQGIGGRLVESAKATARRLGYTGLLVKAERSAVGFFERQGLELLPVVNHARDYPYRLWWPAASG